MVHYVHLCTVISHPGLGFREESLISPLFPEKGSDGTRVFAILYTLNTRALEKVDIATYKKLFTNSSPKFISPVPPDYDALPDNYTKAPSEHQCNIFTKEVEPQLLVPVIRSYLKFYTTMPVSKLALFMEKDESVLREQLLRFKHKCQTIAPASPNSPEAQSVSDIDFYIDGEMIHIADTKVARRYGDYFLRQINKLQDMVNK